MSRSRVQVLTLAELAFTIVFALIIISLPQIAEERRLTAELKRVTDELAMANRLIEELQKRIKELEGLVRGPDVPTEQPGKLLSTIPPQCKGEPIERLTVLGQDQFLIAGDYLNVQDIATKHSVALRWAEENRCRHRAVVSWRETLLASDWTAASKSLERYFRIQRGSGVPIP